MIKKIKILFIILLSVIFLFNVCYAKVNTGNYSYSAGGEVSKIGKPIIGAVQTVAAIVAVATLAMLGIRLMLESPDGRAQVKSKLIPYLIGAVMAFAIIPLLSIMYKIFG